MKRANKWAGLAIIVVIAIVQGVGFGQAFVMLDARFMAEYAAFSTLFVLAGLALGLAIEAGIAYAAAMYPGMHGKKEIQLTQGALVSLLAIAPLVLTPVRLYSMDAGLKASMWPVVAFGVVFLFSLAPSLVTIMVAVVNRDALLVKEPRSAVAQSESATGAVAVVTAGAKGAKSANAGSAKSAQGAAGAVAVSAKSEQGAVGWPRKCEHCEGIIGSPNAKGAHMKKHHPELCIRKAIPMEAMR